MLPVESLHPSLLHSESTLFYSYSSNSSITEFCWFLFVFFWRGEWITEYCFLRGGGEGVIFLVISYVDKKKNTITNSSFSAVPYNSKLMLLNAIHESIWNINKQPKTHLQIINYFFLNERPSFPFTSYFWIQGNRKGAIRPIVSSTQLRCFYPAIQLSSTTTTVSLPFLKGNRRENAAARTQGLR